MQGAGGTEGGTARFFIGLVMMVAGGYLFLHSVNVSIGMGLGYQYFSVWGFGVTSGMIFVPFIFGIGLFLSSLRNFKSNV